MFYKKIISMILAAGIIFTQPVFALNFEDVDQSSYQTSIERLSDLGVIKGSYGKYNPQSILTRAEAATMLQRAFKLVDIPTRLTEETKDLEKVFISTDTSVANLSNAVLPAAEDSLNHWGSKAIETILESRTLSLESTGKFGPNNQMTVEEFATAIAKCVYGVEKDIDFIAQGLKDGIIPSDIEITKAPITREQAAYLIDNVVGDKEEFKIISMFVTSDIHGNLVPYKPSGSNMQVGSLSKMNKLIDDFKKIQPNVLLVDGGDSPYNTNLANFFMGKSTVDVMNAMEYDATALGNHDFDYNFENLLGLANRAKYAMLSANTYNADGTYPEEFKPYIIKEVDGVKVAIIGLTDDDSKLTTHYTNTVDIEFKDHMEAAREVVKEVKDKSDVIVALAHLHTHNKELPYEVEGIDIEVGGGNDEFGRPEIINDTVVINPGGVAACISQVNINMYKGEMIGTTFNQIIVNDTLEDDTEVKGILDEYISKMNDMMGEVIGQSSEDFAWSSALVRTQENPLGNVVADSLREYMDADIAFQNGGGVRAAINKGDITINNVYSALPFDNRVVLVETKGQNIWDAIENGLAQYPAAGGRFLQVSGLKYTFDGAKVPGQRLQSVTLEDGTPLDLEKTYKLAANDFLFGGGDGFTMLNVLNKENEIAENVKLISETNDYIRDVFTKYIKENKTVTPVVEGRITIINPQKNEGKLN